MVREGDSDKLADKVVELHSALACSIKVAHKHVHFVFVDSTKGALILHEVDFEVKAVEEAFSALVEREVYSLNIKAVVSHELLPLCVDLPEFLEEGLPCEGVLGECPCVEDFFEVCDLLHFLKSLLPLKESLGFLQVYGQEGVDEVFE